MRIELNNKNLNSKEVYIFGSKLKSENEFFLQIVDSEKKRSRMESYFLGVSDYIDFFIMPVNCPVYFFSANEKTEIVNINIEPVGEIKVPDETWKQHPLFRDQKF